MRKKGIEIISTSAKQYQLCKSKKPEEEPKLNLDATGIPALRMAILLMPITANLRTLHSHIFETLPDIVDRIKHLQVKFFDEDGYARMRNSLADEVPVLQELLATMSDTLVRERLVQPPVAPKLEQTITRKMKDVVDIYRIGSMHFQTFAKVLRDHGIPVRGKALGKNLNQEIHQPMEPYVQTWKEHVLPRANEIANELTALVHSLLGNIDDRLSASSGDPLLKQSALTELENTMGRIENAIEVLKTTLLDGVQDTTFTYTTETNIYSPVARIMKPIYQQTLFQRQVHQGGPVYLPMRYYLYKATVSSEVSVPVLSKFKDSLQSYQINLWKKACEEFSLQALTHINDFAQVTKNLVDREFYATPEHESFRAQLNEVMPEFEKSLAAIQTQFSKIESGRRMPKKSRLYKAVRHATAQASQTTSRLESLPDASGGGDAESASIPATQDEPSASRLSTPELYRSSPFLGSGERAGSASQSNF
jgi:hypothetical protein